MRIFKIKILSHPFNFIFLNKIYKTNKIFNLVSIDCYMDKYQI